MNSFSAPLLFLVAFINAATSTDLFYTSTDLTTCDLSNTTCTTLAAAQKCSSINAGIPGFVGSAKTIAIPTLTTVKPNLDLVFTNAVMSGLDTCSVAYLAVNESASTMELQLSCTALVFEADVFADGAFGVDFFVKADGHGMISYNSDIVVSITSAYSTYTRCDKEYIQLSSGIYVQVTGSVESHVSPSLQVASIDSSSSSCCYKSKIPSETFRAPTETELTTSAAAILVDVIAPYMDIAISKDLNEWLQLVPANVFLAVESS